MGQEARMDQESFMRTGSNENRLPTAIPTRASMPLPRAPPSGQPNARVVPAAGNRRLSSFREVAGAVCRNGPGGGITLSESIRNSGMVLEEQEAKIRQLHREMESLSNELQGKDRELQTVNTTMADRMDKKQKEIDQLRDNARASEMAIRGLEDEIRLLRKQNNEIDRAARHGQARNANQPSPSGDDELNAKLSAAEQQARQLKQQVAQGEEELQALRHKLAALQAQVDAQKAAGKSGEKDDKAPQAQVAALEKKVGERDKELRLLRDEVLALKEAVKRAEEAAAKAKRETDETRKPATHGTPAPASHPGDGSELAELKARLSSALEKQAAAAAEVQKALKSLDAEKKRAAELEKRLAELEAQMKAAKARLEPAEAEVMSLKEQLGRATSEVEGLAIRGRRQEEEAKRRDLEIEELRKQVRELEALLEARGKQDKSASLEARLRDLDVELAALRVRCQAAEDSTQTHKLAATEANALASIHKTKADTVGRQLSESEAVVVELRCRIAELEKSDKEALARLCKIRELEAEVQASNRRVVGAESERDSAQSSCRIFEKQLTAVKEAAAAEKKELEKSVLRLEAELEELSKRPPPPAAPGLPPDIQQKLEEYETLRKMNALSQQIHKLQMLLRMAEITKLEEHIKCTRRSDSVKDEKMGLLTYNLASAESQIAQENAEAGQKRQAVREERMGVLNKKQKSEEDKMRTNEESFNTQVCGVTKVTHTQSKRLKEKLRELELQLKYADSKRLKEKLRELELQLKTLGEAKAKAS